MVAFRSSSHLICHWQVAVPLCRGTARGLRSSHYHASQQHEYHYLNV